MPQLTQEIVNLWCDWSPKSGYYDIVGVGSEWAASAASFRV